MSDDRSTGRINEATSIEYQENDGIEENTGEGARSNEYAPVRVGAAEYALFGTLENVRTFRPLAVSNSIVAAHPENAFIANGRSFQILPYAIVYNGQRLTLDFEFQYGAIYSPRSYNVEDPFARTLRALVINRCDDEFGAPGITLENTHYITGR